MTTLAEALREFGTDKLQALAEASLTGRNEAAKSGNHAWAGLMNATLCAAVDEQADRRRADVALFEHLELDPLNRSSPVRIIGVERPDG